MERFTFFLTFLLFYSLMSGASANPLPLAEPRAILSDCEKLTKSKNNDVYGRNIVGTVLQDLGGCSRSADSSTPLARLAADMDKIQKTVSRQAMLSDLNDTELRSLVKALLANEHTLGDPSQVDFENFDQTLSFIENALAKEIPASVLDQKQSLIRRAFNEVRQSKATGRLGGVNHVEEAKKFNLIGSQINSYCSEIYHSYQKAHPQGWGKVSDVWDSDEEDDYRNQFRTKMSEKFLLLFTQTKLGHLLGTEHFRQSAGNPGEDLVEKCSEEDGFIAMKPIQKEDILLAKEQMSSNLAEMAGENQKRRQTVSRGYRKKIDSDLEKVIKEDPHLLSQMLAENPEKASDYSYALCKEVLDIHENDEFWQWTDTAVGIGGLVVGAAGLVAGAVLTATGVGAPAGLAIISGIVGVAAGSYDVASGLAKRSESIRQLQASTLASANGVSSSDSFLTEIKASQERRDEGTFQATTGAGGALLEGAAAFRLISASTKGSHNAKNLAENAEESARRITPSSREVPDAAFSEEGRQHVLLGEFSDNAGKGVKLTGGMHTEEGLEYLLKNNEEVRDIMTVNGKIKPEFVRSYPNGVRQIIIPRPAFNSKAFGKVANVAKKFGGAFTGEVNGYKAVGKTLFPKSWNERKILDAANDIIKRDKGIPHEVAPVIEHSGEVDGVKIMITQDKKTKEILTMYPILD